MRAIAFVLTLSPRQATSVMIAVWTDAHSVAELDFVRCGLDQARRAGLQKSTLLNGLPWSKLQPLFRR
jgi:DNA polymerase (family X)